MNNSRKLLGNSSESTGCQAGYRVASNIKGLKLNSLLSMVSLKSQTPAFSILEKKVDTVGMQ